MTSNSTGSEIEGYFNCPKIDLFLFKNDFHSTLPSLQRHKTKRDVIRFYSVGDRIEKKTSINTIDHHHH